MSRIAISVQSLVGLYGENVLQDPKDTSIMRYQVLIS